MTYKIRISRDRLEARQPAILVTQIDSSFVGVRAIGTYRCVRLTGPAVVLSDADGRAWIETDHPVEGE